MTAAYPLSWPEHIPRSGRREASRFKTSLASALRNVQGSLRLFGSDSGKKVEAVVISSNVTLGVERPADPGVAVWFTWDGLSVSIPVDRYQTVEANLQAIHHIVEARRTELRHGSLHLVRATFMGFKALPPASSSRHWSDVLGVGRTASRDDIERAFRERARKAHPDAGGTHEAMTALTRARDVALAERS